MKKIVSLVGVGAMVMALGLGSAMAQQTTPTDPKAPVVKEQPAPEKAKAGVEVKAGEVKADKAAPAKSDEKMVKAEGTTDKTPATTVAPAKPGEKVPSPTVAPVKPEVKPENKADVKTEKKDAPQAKADVKADEAKPVK